MGMKAIKRIKSNLKNVISGEWYNPTPEITDDFDDLILSYMNGQMSQARNQLKDIKRNNKIDAFIDYLDEIGLNMNPIKNWIIQNL